MNLEVAACLAPVITATEVDGSPVDFRSFSGGRGGLKSWTIGRVLLFLGMCKQELVLCGREYQRSIADSVHRLLKTQIEMEPAFRAEYQVRKTYILNRRTGTEFIYAGLHHNIQSIKSIEAVTHCWVEEAETVSQDSWDVLIPTIRRPGRQFWVSFNPKEEDDPTYRMFCKNPPKDMKPGDMIRPGVVHVHTTWEDNPWLPDELRREALWMRDHDPERYAHIWGGRCWHKNDAQVLNGKWKVKEFDVDPSWGDPRLGNDHGFANDPEAVVKSYIKVLNPEDEGKTVKVRGNDVPVPLHKDLYIVEEAFGYKVDLPDLPALFDQVSESRDYVMYSDCSRPETISYMKQYGGFPLITPCEKWEGCVEDGVAHLRGFDNIFIHPACTNITQEARLWSFKVDKLSGKVLRKLMPGFDHGWDAVRYSHEKDITRKKSMFDLY